MDLQLYLRVLWRFRFLVLLGLVFALTLTFLSLVRVSMSGHALKVSYRTQPVYQSDALLFITQEGFPWGRAVQGYLPGNVDRGEPPVPVGDSQRLSSLAQLYAQLANSDDVQRILRRNRAVTGAIRASVVPAPDGSNSVLPMVDIQGRSDSASGAVATARVGAQAFEQYISEQQSAAAIPSNQRVLLQVLNQPRGAIRINGPKKTLPIVIFLTVMMAFIGLVFMLENLRPRIRPARTEAYSVEPTGARRSA